MNLLLVIELFYAGLSTGIFLMLALYLLLSKRSAFLPDSEPDTRLRMLMGWIALAMVILSIPTLVLPILDIDGENIFGSDVIYLVQFLIVPMLDRLVTRFIQFPYHQGWKFALHYLIPILLIIWHIMAPSHRIILTYSAYWVIYVLLEVMNIIKKKNIYQEHLRELYSDLEMHDIRWINYLIGFFIVYLIIFTCAYLNSDEILYLAADASGLFLWFYLVYQIDVHSRNITLTEETFGQESLPETHLAEESSTGCKPRGERDLSWIGERLLEHCEQQHLYLNHDMNIDMLAAQLCTNRTYISQYLSSQGSTYYDYVNRLRIKYAKQQIDDNPTISLSTVAFQSGFRSDSTFRRAFLEIEKCTPSEYANTKRNSG